MKTAMPTLIRKLPFLLMVMSCATAVAAGLEGGVFSIRQGTVSAGQAELEGRDFNASGTMGMPAVGEISGGDFKVSAGVVIQPASQSELVFRNGFEG